MFFGGTGDPRFSCSMLILRSRFRASRAFAKKCYPSPTGEALRVPDVAPRRPGLECPPKPAGGAPWDLLPFCYTRSAKPVPASEKTLRHAKDASGAHRIHRRRGICGQKGVDPVLPAPGISLLLISAFLWIAASPITLVRYGTSRKIPCAVVGKGGRAVLCSLWLYRVLALETVRGAGHTARRRTTTLRTIFAHDVCSGERSHVA